MKARTIATLLAVLLLAGAAVPLAATAQDGGNQTGDENDTDAFNDSDDVNETEEENGSEENETEEMDDEADDEEENESEENESETAEEEDERDRDEEDEGDDGEREERREVEVSTDDEGVEIELKREDAASEDKVEMAFKTEDAEFEVKYEQEEGENETEQKLEAAFQALAEYRDANNNSAWDPGEPIVSAWALGEDADDLEGEDGEDLELSGQADWATPTVEDITVDNKTGKLITAPASLGDEGTFELRFYVFGDFVDLQNSTLEPTSVKIDIVIEDYPYQENDTALALFMETKTELEQEHETPDGDDDEGVSATGSGNGTEVTLRFTWKDHANVDGTDHPVHTTVLKTETSTETDEDGTEQESKRAFALSYARGTSIVHDPKASVQIQSAEDAPASATPGWTTLLVLAGLAATAVAARSGRTW